MLQPRYHQKQAIDNFFTFTANNWGKHPLIIIPTAGGKSLVQAYILKMIYESPGTRILLLTHQQELIKQNYMELMDNFSGELFLDAGIYSAGLKCRDTKNRILFAGIQSVHKKPWELGWFDVIMIDESHLIPHKGEGMYRKFLAEMEKINKNVIIVGLTATGYRLKEGLLTEGEGALFDSVCHETTVKELMEPSHYKNLDKKQYLCTLISKSAINKADLSNVHMRGGEYIPGEMENAFIENDLVCKAVKEIKEYTIDRNKILVFTSGIKHCEDVVNKMLAVGMNSRCVHSKQSNDVNQKNIQGFKDGDFQYLINVNSLTTGFNEKAIDCIVLLRSTMSPGLYYQMAGRGLRLHPSKENCLVLDFGRNVEKHGPIDKIEVRKKKDGTTEIGTAPQKECPVCRALLHLSVMECPECGYIIPGGDKHDETASTQDIISKWKKPERLEVQRVSYSRHEKSGGTDSFRVDYYVSAWDKFSSWICIEHTGFAKRKAMQWLKTVTDRDITSIDEAMTYSLEFLTPSHITVDTNDKFPKIVGYEYSDEKKPIQEKPKEYAAATKTESIDDVLGKLLF